MTHVGMPPQAIEHARQAPMWPYMRGMAPTLIYDYAVLNARRWRTRSDRNGAR